METGAEAAPCVRGAPARRPRSRWRDVGYQRKRRLKTKVITGDLLNSYQRFWLSHMCQENVIKERETRQKTYNIAYVFL